MSQERLERGNSIEDDVKSIASQVLLRVYQ